VRGTLALYQRPQAKNLLAGNTFISRALGCLALVVERSTGVCHFEHLKSWVLVGPAKVGDFQVDIDIRSLIDIFSSSVMCFAERRTQPEALQLIKKCLTLGDFLQSKHFREKLATLAAEKGVTILDVIYIGQHGGIYSEPEFDTKCREWNYRLEGTSPDGLLISIIFSLKADDFALLITIFIQR